MSAIAEPAQTQCFEGLREVADLYAAQSTRVRRLVHLHVQASDALVEDACQVAWMRLIRHRTRVNPQAADRWLVRVAVNEALKLIRRGDRDVSLDELGDQDREDLSSVPDVMQALAEQRARLATIRDLPERQARLVWLQGLGFSYAEMSSATGDTPRTVERQLLRARCRLARSQT
jgi:RNA polymerase sigma factor (sigma-70 family)